MQTTPINTCNTKSASDPALGQLFVIAAPSGAGKTSLVNALVQQLPQTVISVSFTTRLARSQEKNGMDYHFIDEATFSAMVANNDFLEYAEVYGHHYGTGRHWVLSELQRGHDVILEIDWQGAQWVRAAWPSVVSIYILPPNLQVLQERLAKRAQDKPEVMLKRYAAAKSDLQHYIEFDYLVVNDDFDQALADLAVIFKANRLKTPKQQQRHRELLSLLVEFET